MILDRYTATGVYQWTALSAVILVSLRAFHVFVDESDHMGAGELGILDVLLIILLKVPGFLVEVFPVSALLGGLLALGVMARHAEITAIRTAGVSLWRILGSVMLAGLGLAVFIGLIGEFAVPAAEQQADSLRANKLGQPSILHTTRGYWFRDGHSFVNIREVEPGPRLRGVFIYEMADDWHLKYLHRAESGEYRNGQWILKEVAHARTTIDKVINTFEDEWVSPLKVAPAFLDLAAIKPTVMSVRDLSRYLRFLKDNGQSNPEYEAALWTKVTVPVATLVLLILAVASVLGNQRSVDIGARVLAGAVAGAVFVILTRATSFASLVYDVPPILAAWVPLVLFTLVGLFYLKRLN